MQQAPEVPYRDGMDFGVGIDSPSGNAQNVAVTGEPSAIALADGDITTIQIHSVQSMEDLHTAMGISVSASGGVGLFSASARFDYANDLSYNSSSLFVAVKVQVTKAFMQIRAPGITQTASDLLAAGSFDQFQEEFGDVFVRGIKRGGLLIGIITIQTESESDKQKLDASLSASYGTFNGSVSFSSSFNSLKQNSNLQVKCYAEGGLGLVLPTTVAELMSFASNFPAAIDAHPVPYSALLSSYTILPVPKEPNFIDLQHQQDVLTNCANLRIQYLQICNDIKYILANPQQFTNSDGHPVSSDDLTKLALSLNVANADLDIIAKTASQAVDFPKNAQNPQLQLSLATLTLPRRLHDTLQVQIPDVTSMKWHEGVNFLNSLGLKVTIDENSLTVDATPIIGTTPPIGTMVDSGSTVVIHLLKLKLKPVS